MLQNTDDPQRTHPCAHRGSERLPTSAAHVLAGGGKWLFNYSSSLLVAYVLTGGLKAEVGRMLALISVAGGLTVLGRWAHPRTSADGGSCEAPFSGSAPSGPAPPATPAFGTPPSTIPRPRPAPPPGTVTTVYRLQVSPGTGLVDLTPLIEIRHDGQRAGLPSLPVEPSVRTEEEALA